MEILGIFWYFYSVKTNLNIVFHPEDFSIIEKCCLSYQNLWFLLKVTVTSPTGGVGMKPPSVTFPELSWAIVAILQVIVYMDVRIVVERV